MEGQVFDAEFVRYIAQTGAVGVIAALLFAFYRKDVRNYTELWQTQLKLNYNQMIMMMTVVKDNTIAITQNTEMLRSLHRRVDRLDMLRVVAEDEGKSATP